MADRADRFEWSGGHPALDLVNTVDERPSDAPIENLAAYRDLVRFATLAGLVAPALGARLLPLEGRACSRIVKRARALREHLHGVLAAAHAAQPAWQRDLDAMSVAVQAAHAARRLVVASSVELAELQWSPAVAPDIPLHACALAIERLLISEERSRIRRCGAADCAVYYIDVSKGQIRQWCSMKGCGNREKQRRRRAK